MRGIDAGIENGDRPPQSSVANRPGTRCVDAYLMTVIIGVRLRESIFLDAFDLGVGRQDRIQARIRLHRHRRQRTEGVPAGRGVTAISQARRQPFLGRGDTSGIGAKHDDDLDGA